MIHASRHSRTAWLALVAVAFAPAVPVAQLIPSTFGEEFVVSATRLHDPAEALAEREVGALPPGSVSLPGLAQRVANFHVTDGGARGFTATSAVRGLVNTPLFGDPAVTYYLGEFPLGSGLAVPFDLSRYESAELHLGPGAGTRFGSARPGGVVVLEPSQNATTGGAARFGFGSHGQRNLAGRYAIHRDHSDVLIAFGEERRDGFVRNETLNRQIDDRDARSALLRYRIRPSAESEWTLLFAGTRTRDGVQALVPLEGPLYSVTRSGEGEMRFDSWNAGLSGAFTTAWGRLLSATSAGEWKLDPYANVLAFGPAELANAAALEERTLAQEIRATSKPNAALRWESGIFASRVRSQGQFERAFGPFAFEESTYRIDRRSLAAFGEFSRTFVSGLTFSGGLRGEWSRRTFTRDEAIPVQQTYGLAHASSAILPRLSATYSPSADRAFFGSIVSGWKPGGYSGFTGNRNLAAFGPERTRGVEAGMTSGTETSPVRSTVRVFAYAISGYQIERSFATGAAADDYLVVNAPRARSVGAEFELNWQLRPGWSLTAELGVTRVELRHFVDPFGGLPVEGNQAPYVPRYEGSVRAAYHGSTGFFAEAEYLATGRTDFTEGADPRFAQKAFALVGLRTGYERGNWRISFCGENLRHERYFSSITPGTGHGTPGNPRTWFAELSVDL